METAWNPLTSTSQASLSSPGLSEPCWEFMLVAIKTLVCAASGDKGHPTGASGRQRGFQCHKLGRALGDHRWACQLGGMEVAFLEEVVPA